MGATQGTSPSFILRFLRSAIFPAVCLLALSATLYGNSLYGEFVYDDFVYVVHNALQYPSALHRIWLENLLEVRHYRPLTFFTFALNFTLTGTSPLWFHAVSIALNGLTAWLLFVLVIQLFGDRRLAWIAALLFVVLPIHTEAVAYIKARDEILVAFFGLLSWSMFLRASDETNRISLWYGLLSATLSLCAFLSKESALVLPGVLGGTLLLMQGFKGVRRASIPLLLQIVAIAAYFALQNIAQAELILPEGEFLYFGQNPLGYMDARYIPWTAAMLFFLAAGKTLIPWNLSATYGFAHLPPIDTPFGSWMALPGIALLCTFIVLIAHPRTRRTPLGIGALTFLVLYFPFSKIPLVNGMDFFGERWLYAPSIGLSMIVAYGLTLLAKRWQHCATAILICIIMAYVAVLIPRNLVWSNATTLGESMIRSAPQSVVSYGFLARERLKEGRTEEASGLVGKGLRVTRRHLPLHLSAALVALDMGDVDLADQAVSAAEELGRNELDIVILRSTVLATQRKFQESLNHLVRCRTLNMNHHRVRFLLALNLWKLGRKEEAETFFDWEPPLTGPPLSWEDKIWLLESF